MGFLDEYEQVDVRIDKFWADHPDGRIVTDLVSHADGEWVFSASCYRADGSLAATGFAHEVTGTSSVNKTSACENCETSAIGRALANMNYAAKGKRPSREEMQKTVAPQPAPKEVSEAIVAMAKVAGIGEWIREQNFAWPYTFESCARIAAHAHGVLLARTAAETTEGLEALRGRDKK